MCGIAGTVDLERGLPSAEPLVLEMLDVLAHRGPDDAGLLVDRGAVLGHRRLSIIDLSPAGHQPMSNPDGTLWITYNGEIYNYKELARDLRLLGYRFRSSSDTEVLLYAFMEWGPDALARLNGMFAFAIWDRRHRRLFCARDRFGVKPFYYTVAGGRFRFASEIKALILDPDVRRAPNDDRVLDFLVRGVMDHTGETMFAGVNQLEPGTYAFVDESAGLETPVTWYRPQPAEVDGRRPVDALRELLQDAVEIRLRSDVPVGTTLSGGLDSTTITAIAANLRERDGAEPPDSFTSRCRTPAGKDEGHFVQLVVEATGSRNHANLPTDDEVLATLDHVLWHMDEPYHTSGVYAHWRLMGFARSEGITVLLDGNGGDEALLGYHYLLYPAVFFALAGHGRLRTAAQELAARRRLNGIPFHRSVKDGLKLAAPASLRGRRLPNWLNSDLDVPRLLVAGASLRAQHLHGIEVSPLPMHNHEGDRDSMAFSVETRNPFLDYRIVEFGLALPPQELLRDGLSKHVLREAARGLVPDQIVDRHDKQGFSTDEVEWMRGTLGRAMEDAFVSESMADRRYFRREGLFKALGMHRAGDNRHWELWRAFIVERWLRLFVDSPRIDAPPVPVSLPVEPTREVTVTRLSEDVIGVAG